MEASSKLQEAVLKAATILDARPDPVLANIARNAGPVVNMYDHAQGAISFDYLKDGETKMQSWPGIGYLPDAMMALTTDEIGQQFVAVIDQEDARVKIDR